MTHGRVERPGETETDANLGNTPGHSRTIELDRHSESLEQVEGP